MIAQVHATEQTAEFARFRVEYETESAAVCRGFLVVSNVAVTVTVSNLLNIKDEKGKIAKE